jgi:hypothetical protein
MPGMSVGFAAADLVKDQRLEGRHPFQAKESLQIRTAALPVNDCEETH